VSHPTGVRACDDALALLSLSLDEELSTLERRKLERHLRFCPACRRTSVGIEGATVALRGLPLETPSASFSPHAPWRRRVARTGLSTMAAVAFASLGLVALQGSVNGDSNGITSTVTVPEVSSLSPITSVPQPQRPGFSFYGDIAWAP
jgi:predicted anti-sigma-YlaC factor YlaD